MKKYKLRLIAIFTVVGLALTSCNKDEDAPANDNTIVGLASNNANLSLLVKALTKTSLVTTLKGTGPFTVFAPTNTAFENANYTASVIDNLDAAGIAKLKEILLNHVISGAVTSTQLATTPSLYVNTFASGPGATKLSMYIATTTTPTVSVVINGGKSTASGDGKKGATVTTANVTASNGVVHIVDGVIGLPTIVDLVVTNPEFDTLQTVVTSTTGSFGNQSAVLADLSNLTPAAPGTLFAPNNAAFTSLLSELSTAGIVPTPLQYSSVLRYHAVSGNLRAAALPGIISGPSAGVVPTLNTQNITLSLTGGAKITGAFTPTRPASNIILTDIQGSNGVIHVLDKVLLPTL